MFKFLVLAVSFLILSAGCATMFSDKSDPMLIESDPPGAQIYFRGQFLGKTPLTIDLPRRPEAPYFTAKLEGYENKNVSLGRTIAPSSFFNFGFTTTTSGVTSWGIDALTGKMWQYTPNSFVIKLDKKITEFWSEQVFEYVMTNSENLKKDLARQDGAYLQAFCHLLNWQESHCQSFAKKAASETKLISAPHSLAFYRELKNLNEDKAAL